MENGEDIGKEKKVKWKEWVGTAKKLEEINQIVSNWWKREMGGQSKQKMENDQNIEKEKGK